MQTGEQQAFKMCKVSQNLYIFFDTEIMLSVFRVSTPRTIQELIDNKAEPATFDYLHLHKKQAN